MNNPLHCSHHSALLNSLRYTLRPILLSALMFSPYVAAAPSWGEFQQDDCTHSNPATRQYSAVLNNIPWGQSWEAACAVTEATINGQTYSQPHRCVNTGFAMWGEFDVADASCEANWATLVGTDYHTHQDDGCQTSGQYAGKRKYSSRLWNVSGESWEQACAEMSMTLAGKTYTSPHACINTQSTGMWGEWYLPDSSCSATPASYVRGVDDLLKSTDALSGYIDMHTHLMSHLGFGGTIFHGSPYGEPAVALASCPSGNDEDHAEGHSRVEDILKDDLIDILGAVLATSTHENAGYNTLPFWPAYNSYTHQTMYYDWLKRAYEGGMRTMVALAVNGDYMFGATDNGLPDIIKGTQIATNPVYDLNDMETLRRQTAGVYAMQDWIDQKYGGAGLGWFRIVTSAAQAQSVIASGKLAVVLGSEVDYLADCDLVSCAQSQVDLAMQEIYDLGIRYVFPIHLKTNGFGGAAIYNILASGDTYDCKHYSQDCNLQGLTVQGEILITELMKKGMIIDVGHMSARSLADTLDIAESEAYPGIVTGHTGAYDMANQGNRHEGNLKGEDFQRIVALGGMIGLIAGQGNREEVSEWHEDDGSYLAHACGGTSQTFAQSYLYLKHLLGSDANAGRISVGTDFNGFAHMPGPRFGTDACPGGSSTISQTTTSQVIYPFATDPALINAATQATPVMFNNTYQFGQRSFDFNTQGLSHIGLMPEFFEDLRQQGLSRSDLEPVYRSAGYFTQMWQAAEIKSQSVE